MDSRVHAKKLPISTAPIGLRVYIFPQVREKLYIKFPKRQVWQFFKCARCARKFRLSESPILVKIIFFFTSAQKISNVETCCIKPMGHLATTFPGRAKKNEKMELR